MNVLTKRKKKSVEVQPPEPALLPAPTVRPFTYHYDLLALTFEGYQEWVSLFQRRYRFVTMGRQMSPGDLLRLSSIERAIEIPLQVIARWTDELITVTEQGLDFDAMTEGAKRIMIIRQLYLHATPGEESNPAGMFLIRWCWLNWETIERDFRG